VSHNPDNAHKGLFRLDLQVIAGSGRLDSTDFSGTAIQEAIKEANSLIQANLHRLSLTVKYKDFDYHLKATDLNGIGKAKDMELAIFLSLCSGILKKPLLSQMVVLGSMSIGGTMIGTQSLPDALQIASDSGAKRILIPALDMTQMAKVPLELMSKFQLIIYSDPIDALLKAVGVK